MRTHQDLEGRPVRFSYSVARHKRAGTYYGIVRKVQTKGRGDKERLVGVTVQRPDGTQAASYAARCQGERVKLERDFVQAVQWRGRWLTIDEYLEAP